MVTCIWNLRMKRVEKLLFFVLSILGNQMLRSSPCNRYIWALLGCSKHQQISLLWTSFSIHGAKHRSQPRSRQWFCNVFNTLLRNRPIAWELWHELFCFSTVHNRSLLPINSTEQEKEWTKKSTCLYLSKLRPICRHAVQNSLWLM